MDNGFYSASELMNLGLKRVGSNVRISKLASLYRKDRISIGDNVRIDDFCVISAGEEGIDVGNYVHIAVYSSLIGKGQIRILDYANISSRVSIYSSNDDYSGNFMSNPTVPDKFTKVTHAPVTIGKHVIIGSGSVVLPGIVLEEGVVIGDHSLVKTDCLAFKIYGGVPAKVISERSTGLLKLERDLITSDS